MTTPQPDDVQRALHGTRFPAHRDELVGRAGRNDASPAILDALRALPDRSYSGPDQVCMAVCGRFGHDESDS